LGLFLFLGGIGVWREVGKHDSAQTDPPHMYEYYHADVLAMVVFIHMHLGNPLLLHTLTHTHTHTLKGLIRGLMSCRPACCVFLYGNICVCVCVVWEAC